MSYSVYVAKSSDMGEVPGAEIFWMSKFGQYLPLQTNIGIVRGHGKTILINTGPPLEYLDYMNEIWREELGDQTHISVAEEEYIVNILHRYGLTPNDIDYVIVTPLQAYAIGNVHLFKNAEICVSRTGWIDLFAPRHFDPRRKMAVPDHLLQYLLFEAWPVQKIRLLEDEDEILPGVRTWWAGTHHRSSLAVEVDTSQGIVTFSDIAFYYANIENNHPLGIMESLEECKDAYTRIQKSTSIFIPLYDPNVFTRFPDGRVIEDEMHPHK